MKEGCSLETADSGEAKTDKQHVEETLLKYLNESLSDDEKEQGQFNLKDAQKYMQAIREEIDKYQMKLAGNDKRIRYSPKVIQIAMCLWMRSPTAYKELRNSGWIINFPHASRLKALRQETKVQDGECMLMYCRYAAHTPKTSTPGHLSCDEMKLDKNVAWYTNGHDTAGFVTNFHDLDGKLRRILCGESSNQPAVEVNQWKYRTCTTSESFECEFFYNAGNLSNADIRRQFLHVVTCLEVIGREVWGLSTDGNSNNVKAMRILAESAGVSISPTEEWLDDMHVSLPHPLFENRRIYLWLCSTHEEKCGRNQLWASRPKGK
jgi:hypothetical protein